MTQYKERVAKQKEIRPNEYKRYDQSYERKEEEEKGYG